MKNFCFSVPVFCIIVIFVSENDSSSAHGITGMINTAKTLHSVTSSVTSLLSNYMATATTAVNRGKRGSDRLKHNYFIDPLVKKNKYIPMLWDMAPKSYPVDFMLYTRNNRVLKEVLNVANATGSKMFVKMRDTKIIIHDYNQSASDPLLLQLRNVYFNHNNDYNIIIADWEQARMYSYTVAATVTEYVGIMGARLVNELDMDPSRVHVIGYGLGAHAAGVLGHELKGKVQRITGLDPSLPLFRMADDSKKLDDTDARFVDVIHTDGGDNFWHASHLGMGDQMGHADFYVNSGIFQPGCPIASLPSYEDMHCSHLRALELFVESVVEREDLIACSCNSWTAFQNSKCDCLNRMIYIGEHCPQRARGKFFLVTRQNSPYGMGRKGAYPPSAF